MIYMHKGIFQSRRITQLRFQEREATRSNYIVYIKSHKDKYPGLSLTCGSWIFIHMHQFRYDMKIKAQLSRATKQANARCGVKRESKGCGGVSSMHNANLYENIIVQHSIMYDEYR